MDKTAYQQLKDAERLAGDLQGMISRCKHEFVSEVPKQRVISVPVRDPWSGISVTNEQSYAMVGRRSCTHCGLVQESISEKPGEWNGWKNV